MAAGSIQYAELTRGYNVTDGYYIHGMVIFSFNAAYTFHDDSIRIYYTTDPEVYSQNEPHVDLVPPGRAAHSDDPDAYDADSWEVPFSMKLATNVVNKAITLGLTNAKYKVTFTIKHLSEGVTYYTRAWLRLYKSATANKVAMKYHDPPGEGIRKEITMLGTPPTPSPSTSDDEKGTLFGIAKYTETSASSEKYIMGYENFTDCIKLPSYNVNSEDVNEDWEDANYETHRIVARKKVTGKFEMIFPTMKRQKEFFNYLELSKQLNDSGIAYVELRVQVNNVFELKAGQSIDTADPLVYMGKFFVKIDNNAWIQPIFGHYDKYNPLSITITEA